MAFKAHMSGVPMHMMADGDSINTIPAEFLIDIGLMVNGCLFPKDSTTVLVWLLLEILRNSLKLLNRILVSLLHVLFTEGCKYYF